jgi:ADP-ribose pyrophosphatase YjhB (NUDIX family)
MKLKGYGICLYTLKGEKIKILLCKSVSSLNKWGCLKGVQEPNETKEQTAQREFFEECKIKVPIKLLTNYFEQINDEKDIGIYLVNGSKVKNLKQFFSDDFLHKHYLCSENSTVKFFDINNLPTIKKKQSRIIKEIIDFLKSR